MDTQKMVSFDKEQLKELKKQYKLAVTEDKKQFTMDGLDYLTAYAKYLIEYLETKLN